MRPESTIFLLLLIGALPTPAIATAHLTIQAYDQDDQPVVAEVVIDGDVVGNAWSPIRLDAGLYLVIVRHGASQRTESVLITSSDSRAMSVFLGPSVPMVRVEPGSFHMGSPADEPGRGFDETQHPVELTEGFWISTTEVSQALYKEVTGENPSRWIDPLRPVENVTWFDCIRFCNQLSEQWGLQPAYSIHGHSVDWDRGVDGFRLPTEAEWEYASRAGTTTAYHFGDDPSQLYRFANYCDRVCERAWSDTTQVDGFFYTAPVGSFKPNAWGLYDMHGNLWEWCWDWWGPFEAHALVDPVGPPWGSKKIERGGCWEVGLGMCRQAFRHYVEPDQKRSYLGMRIVRTIATTRGG